MRSDLQNILNTPSLSPSVGHARKNKQLVLAWLYLQHTAPQIILSVANMVTKVTALQGVSDDSMLDLQIAGLVKVLGLTGQTWAQLKASASAAINGQGITSAGLSVAIQEADLQRLINFAILMDQGTIADAS